MTPRIQMIRERFMRDSSDRRLGAIASDLMRIASLLSAGSAGIDKVRDVLTELKLFTEWAADELSLTIQETLLDLQREIRTWNPDRKDFDRSDVARRANAWSEKILISSGLAG